MGRHFFSEKRAASGGRRSAIFCAKWHGCSARSPTRSSNRTALLARLADKARPAGKVTVGLSELDAAAAQVGNMFDPVNGGLRGAPKFPQPAILEMLWRAGLRGGDPRFFDTVEHSLERTCEGGIATN